MSYRLMIVLVSLLSLGLCMQGHTDSTRWWLSLGATNETWVGAQPGCVDGYDGQSPFDLSGSVGLNLYLYRQAGPGWSGPTGFYGEDFESPIPVGRSKTWWDLYMWTGNPTFSPSAYLKIMPDGPWPPAVYWAQLVIDYVPDSLNWTGPMQYTVTLDRISYLLVPVPLVSDGLQGTKMHLTVNAFPIPEPSTLSFLSLALVGVGVGRLRRRRAA